MTYLIFTVEYCLFVLHYIYLTALVTSYLLSMLLW